MKNWIKRKSSEIFSSKYFHLRVDECEMFDGRVMPRYYVVDFPDWVQVIALDKNKNLVLVEQYRYPGQGWFLEFPGGSTDATRKEDPLAAAQRELKEETGYVSNEWLVVGTHFPNPALLTNRCHVFLAKNCEKQSEQELDPFEEINVQIMSGQDFEKKFLEEPGQHSLMLASYLLAKRYL